VVEVEGRRVTSFEALGAGLLGVTDGDAVLLFEDGGRAVLPVPRDPEARVELVSLLMPDETPSRAVEGMGEAAAAGVRQVASTTRLAARSTELVASGALTVRQISGPVGLAALAERMLEMGWSSFLAYVAFLSVSLAFMNILPIPTLDGGHVVFVLLERLLGRPLPSRAVRLASVAGGTLVVGIMLIALTSDVMRLLGA
jgi:regulator of sigma E protease